MAIGAAFADGQLLAHPGDCFAPGLRGQRFTLETPFQRFEVQVGLGQQFLELGVLRLNFAQPCGLAGLHPAELGAPLVEGRFAEAAQAAQFVDRHSGFSLLEESDDLLIGESALLHVRTCLENGLC